MTYLVFYLRKLALRSYLNHEQYSVFTDDITEAQAISLQRELSRLMIPGDGITEIRSANRQNIEVCQLAKSDTGQGEIKRIPLDEHRRDFTVL